MTAGLSRYDQDPEALAWARAKAEHLESRWREFSRDAAEAGRADVADLWRYLANGIRLNLIGNGGCVIAAFDERRASLPAAGGQESR